LVNSSDGLKVGVRGKELIPQVIIYDSKFALKTPQFLFMSTALRAVDHAMETMYHAEATELTRMMALQAATKLFKFLPRYKDDPTNEETTLQLQLAAFASLGFAGYGLTRPLGLSHTLGYALGSPYGIPHGVTSCLTLGHVVKLKAQDPEAARQLARMLPFVGQGSTGDNRHDAEGVGQAILDLVSQLGLKTTLTERGVSHDQIPIITQRALGGVESGQLYDIVKNLVEKLF
jgi:alcohol dehydrogenase class IV